LLGAYHSAAAAFHGCREMQSAPEHKDQESQRGVVDWRSFRSH